MEFDDIKMASGLYPYLVSLSSPTTGVLADMEEYGRRRRFPFIGPLVGRFLAQLAILSGASQVLELGSGFGYSAAWWLLASPRLHVTCTDGSTLNQKRALEFFDRLGCANRVDFRVGDALEVARSLPGPFDIVYCDLNKDAYLQALTETLPKLKLGGLFVADNALWRGYAWADAADHVANFRREAIPAIREFNRQLHLHPQLLTTILPLRDGLALAVKR